MNPKRLCIILVATLTLAASPVCLRAADSPSQCAAPAPADGNAVLRQIELKVAMAQYEKILTAIYDAQLTLLLPEDPNVGTLDERMKSQEREKLRIKVLEEQSARLQRLILELVPTSDGQHEKTK
jgi:hypothetical protein